MARTRRAGSAQDDFLPGFTDVSEIEADDLVTVLRAREAASGRTVSLTLLAVDAVPSWAVDTFDRETASLVALGGHPNVVTSYGTFRAPDGRLVLVGANCPRSFAARVQVAPGGRVPVVEVVSLGTKLARGLGAAHRAQVLHRDIRLGRIMITESGEPALTGFGIAALRAAAGRGPELSALPNVAPELFGPGDFSPAADVYGLASTLYQLLVGRPAFEPHDGETPPALIGRVQRDLAPPIADQQVPAALSELLLAAMAKDPAVRPTVQLFGARLSAITPSAPDARSAARAPAGPAARPGRTPPAATDWSAPTVSRHAAPEVDATPATRPPSSAPERYRADRPDETSPAAATRPARHAAPDEPQAPPRQPPFRDLPLEPDAALPVAPVVPWRSSPLPEEESKDEVPSSPADSGTDIPPESSTDSKEERETRPSDNGQEPDGAPERRPAAPPAVPVWNFRAQEPAGVGAQMRLDPAALRREVTIRASGASLTVDLVKLVSRQWLKKQEIPWREIVGLDTRWDASGAEGVAVAITHHGSIELPATRGTAAELRTTHALLAAYRQRAHLSG